MRPVSFLFLFLFLFFLYYCFLLFTIYTQTSSPSSLWDFVIFFGFDLPMDSVLLPS
ncbi:hypothetical protein BDW75DRAFT_209059 [Aspergillus navahoensis]